ncbi:MAG TPA: citrate/2-methylcitrate synthase [Longimicrobiales bacterium]|nr:citrate/2-methylcitrate synthase [Longimicrobiales bacterium]
MSGQGLEGVVAAQTSLSKVMGEEGRLIYAGYEIGDLAEHTSFEEVCHLLWHGDLPTRAELDTMRAALGEARRLDDGVLDVLRLLPRDIHPMAALRTGLSAAGNFDPDAEVDTEEANRRKAVRITGQIAAISAAYERLRKGEEPLAADPASPLAADFLRMLTGRDPGELEARIMDVALILHADHGLNASTFSARVTIATLSDMYSAIVSAIGTLKGPLHGGANQGVMRMLQAIGEADEAAEHVRAALERKERIMGFGHRVYRALDPRAPILHELAEELGEARGDTRWLDIADAVRDAMRQEMDARGKKIYANVDFYSAAVYYTLGIPVDQFTNIFAISRAAGWTANVLEQLADNRLIRPKAEYVGPMDRTVRPLDERA